MPGLLILLGTALLLLLAILTAMLVREMRRPPRRTAAYAIAKGLPCDPGELNPPLPFEEWWLDRPDGAQLPVWDIKPKRSEVGGQRSESGGNDSEDRSLIVGVFIHGWGHSRIDVLPRLGPFLPFCDRVVLYDLRGHGESRGGLSRLGHGEDDDLLALIDRLGEDRIVLVGHSMGAAIAIHAALKATRRNDPIADRIAGVIAYGAYCEFHDSLRGRLRVAGYPGRPITDLALLALRLGGIKPLNVQESDIAELKRPLLLFHGCDDPVSPLSHARRIAQAVHVTLHEIDGAAHVDVHTIDAQRHDALIAQSLEQFSQSTAHRQECSTTGNA